LFRKTKKYINIDKQNLPVHVAIIPDGNGRWAKKRGLPHSMGHKEGANVIEKIVEYAGNIGIKYISIYAFSTENWTRSKKEVDFLMQLIKEFLDNSEKKIGGKDLKIKIIGCRSELDKDLIKSIENVEKRTEKNNGLTFLLALNYGGRKELVETIKKICSDITDKSNINEINEELISDNLYTKDIPDPDLLIRTSGELRSSNFMIWQMAYTEYVFTNVLWPDFNTKEFDKAIIEFQNRKRRFGGRQ
jgi:undecaprenyl diphosphate synthase